jgi:hypothetical protein
MFIKSNLLPFESIVIGIFLKLYLPLIKHDFINTIMLTNTSRALVKKTQYNKTTLKLIYCQYL